MRFTLLVPLAAALAASLAPHSAAADTFPCSEAGVLAAIAAGGGPHTFDCAGPTTVTTTTTIAVDNDVILDGENNLILDGNETHRVLTVTVGVTAELWNLTITRGSSSGGAGLQNVGTLLLANSTVSDSTATGFGGGIQNGFAGTLTLEGSMVRGNRARRGAGIYSNGTMLEITDSTIDLNVLEGVVPDLDRGAGIYLDRGTLTISSSTLSTNFTRGFGGGAIFSRTGTVTVMDSTLVENTVASANWGGGILNESATVAFTNTTFSDNLGWDGGGAIYNLSGTVTLTNCTVALSDDISPAIVNRGALTLTNTLIVDDECVGDGSFTSGSGNLESPGNSCRLTDPSDQVNVSAATVNLGSLADNGGPTETHALGTGSAAIDTAGPALCPEADQRGVPRPQGLGCDVGAVEMDDADGDDVVDPNDNCVEVANADQRDADTDGYGTACDPDYNNDGAVGIPDFNVFRPQFGLTDEDPGFDPAADHTGDGAIGIPDFNVFRSYFGQAPGPSGLGCAGTVPCPAP